MMGSSRLVLSSFFLLAVVYAEDPVFQFAEDTLAATYGHIIFSAMVFRHGDRSICVDFPTNEHSALFANNKSQLTEAGRIRAHKLGRWTRKRYQHLVGTGPYDLESLGMISSHKQRVQDSGHMFLGGFHRPELEKSDGTHPWKLNAMPEGDRMITMQQQCPRYNVEIDKILKLSYFVKFFEGKQELYANVEKFFGVQLSRQDPISTIVDIFYYYDTLIVMEKMHLKLPNWVPQVYDQMRECAVMFVRLHTFTLTMKRLKVGPLLSHIVDELKAVRDHGKPNKHFQFYSCHDHNIMALLDVLGLWDLKLVPYSSALLFELRKDRDNFIITVLYRNDADSPPRLMNMPLCPNPCSLDDFVQYATELIIPTDWAAECAIRDGERPYEIDYGAILF